MLTQKTNRVVDSNMLFIYFSLLTAKPLLPLPALCYVSYLLSWLHCHVHYHCDICNYGGTYPTHLIAIATKLEDFLIMLYVQQT